MYVLYIYVSFVIVSSPGQPQVYPSIQPYIRVYAFNPFIFTTWVQYQSILSNGQKNELISLGTPKSDVSLLCPRPFFGGEWSSLFPGTNTSAYVCMVSQASHSIQFNPIQPINHYQLRPCRGQLVCLTSSDDSMIPSHSGPFFSFSFIFSLFRQIRARFTRNVARPKRAKTGSYRTLHAIILLLNRSNKIK